MLPAIDARSSRPRRHRIVNLRRLIIRPGAIGDCVLALPAMEFVANVEFTELWVPSAIVPLIHFGQKVRALSSTGLDLMGVGDRPTDQVLASRIQSFDRIVSWYGAKRPDFRSAIENLGVTCEFHSALPPSDYSGHATDFFAQQVGAPLGMQPRIQVKPTAPRDAVVIHPFSGSRRKNWPLEYFQQLASNLKTPVEWNAGPEEPLPLATRFNNLAELASWIAGTRLYIGNDSGITHLAAATGAPVLAIFLTTDPATWAPRGHNVTVLQNPTAQQATEAANRLLGW